jgi:hypothetical protein
MTRLQMAGRWMQVIGGVLAWIVFVPLIEVTRAAAHRIGRTDSGTAFGREVASRPPVVPAHPRRAA